MLQRETITGQQNAQHIFVFSCICGCLFAVTCVSPDIHGFFLQNDLEFCFASRLEDVLDAAFEDGFPLLSKPGDPLPSKL